MTREYTREQLIGVLESYQRMIERDNGKYPAAVLDDIAHSIKAVLRVNQPKAILASGEVVTIYHRYANGIGYVTPTGIRIAYHGEYTERK